MLVRLFTEARYGAEARTVSRNCIEGAAADIVRDGREMVVMLTGSKKHSISVGVELQSLYLHCMVFVIRPNGSSDNS